MKRKDFLKLAGASVIINSCRKEKFEDIPVAYNRMPFHPWDEKMLRLSADNPNGFQGATPTVFTKSFGLRTTMDNVRLTGGGSYDMEVFNNLQIATAKGSIQIQLGYARMSNATGPFQESHFPDPYWPVPKIINPSVPGWKVGNKSTYKIYKVYNPLGEPTSKWRTNIDGTDILEYETFDTDSYAFAQTCGTGIFTTGSGKFPTINWSSALELFDGASWTQAASAREIYCASKVGIESKSKGTLVTGTSITKPPCGTLFW